MNVFLISDTHLKHEAMKTYCQRPSNFTELIHKNIMNTVKPEDTLIHLGDVGISKAENWEWMIRLWPGRKILIRGNHDRQHSCTWWMEHGFDFACDSMMFRNWWLTHEPANQLPWTEGEHCQGNIHGHLHNIWHGFGAHIEDLNSGRLKNPWQRLFAVEYTNYTPICFDKFVSHPDKYQARGPHGKENS
jgi:calcineurin-like phosphoesterase family protein